MSNPWLQIPLADYEGHMTSPAVRQLAVLCDLFAEALSVRQPTSIAIAGVAGGNGLDRIDCNIVRRIVGMDINPAYLAEVRLRFAGLPGLELHCLDLSAECPTCEPVDLIHAALVFEHAGLHPTLDHVLALVSPEGACSVVLQLPAEADRAIGSSGFESIQKLKSSFSLIAPADLTEAMRSRGFSIGAEKQVALPGGKAFWMGIFQRSR